MIIMIQQYEQHDQHTHTHTHTTETDRQTDSMACMGSCGATRGASTPQRSVVSLLLSLGWLGMLTDRLRDRLALAPPCAHGCLGLLTDSTACIGSLFALSLARLLACSCLLAYACLRAHCGSFLGLLEDLPMLMAETALRGWKWLTDGLWDQSLYARTRADRLQWPQKLIEAVLKRFEQSDEQICQLGKENGYRRVSGGLLRINGQEHGESIQPTPPLRYAALDRAIV